MLIINLPGFNLFDVRRFVERFFTRKQLFYFYDFHLVLIVPYLSLTIRT